ncbi:MAG TPA: hypothetical protein VI298_10745 [Geobacteraceae bacterium]
MAEKVTLKLSAAAAAFVRGGAPKEEKLKAARGEVPFSVADLGTLLLFLSVDADPEVKGAAVKSLREMPDDTLTAIAGDPGTHPKVLDLLARIHFGNEAVVEKLISHPAADFRTVEFLAAKGLPLPPVADDSDADPDDLAAVPRGAGEGDDSEAEGEIDEEGEEYLSKYKLCQQMGVADKIKIALTGDKEWRSLLIKDSNKLVSGAAVKNPRITEAEILTIAKSKIQNDEIVRVICMNKDWLKNYQIRKAMVENSKTPLPNALRFMATLTEKDLAALAKSKNVSTVVATQARRLLLAKDKH